jgi:hypothetical protein
LYPLFRPTLANTLIYVPPGPDYAAALKRAGASHLVARTGTEDAVAAEAAQLREVFRSQAYVVYEVTGE